MLDEGRFENEFQRRLAFFEEKFEKRGRAECWNWNAAKTKTGTGIFNLGELTSSASTSAAAAAWFFYRDSSYQFAAGSRCVHLCRNKACVNPDHLAIVSGDELPTHRAILEYLSLRYPDARGHLQHAIQLLGRERE
jgi:hypothetical protein